MVRRRSRLPTKNICELVKSVVLRLCDDIFSEMIVSVSNCLRVAHVFSCVLIIALASVLIPFCVLVWDTFRNLNDLVFSYVTLIPIVFAVTSFALFLLSLLGIWAAAVGSAKSFRIYTLFLTLVLLGKIVWSIVSADLQVDFILAVDNALSWHMEHYPFEPSIMNNVQWKLKCCGKDTPADWFITTGYIPSSCCHNATTAPMYASCMVPEQLYLVPPTGCLRVIGNLPKQYFTTLQLMFHISSIVLGFSLCVSYFMARACSTSEKEHFLIKKNIIEGSSAYETKNSISNTPSQRKQSSLIKDVHNLSKRLSFARKTSSKVEND